MTNIIMNMLMAIALIFSLTACGGGGGGSQVTGNPAFITTWKTDNPGYTASDTILISTNNSGGNFTIDWGDGVIETGLSGDNTHIYGAAGTYTVKITGDFPRIFFGSTNYDPQKLLSVENWGDIHWTSMNWAFNGCSNLVINATDAPDLSNVINMSGMFMNASSFNQPINHWNTSNVIDMFDMFNGATAFNQPLNNWDTHNVTGMHNMFQNASAFNQPIGSWDTSSVIYFSWMFANATSFNQYIGDWNTSSAIWMDYMFSDAVFDQDIGNWDVSGVTSMQGMFANIALSPVNYDALLIGWASQTLQSNVVFDAGNSQYNTSLAAYSRQNIISNYNWTITDGGQL